MCRNHRGFVDATIAAAKLGADMLYLNTAFAGPQLVDVLDREEPHGRRTTRSSPALLEGADGAGCRVARGSATTRDRRVADAATTTTPTSPAERQRGS